MFSIALQAFYNEQALDVLRNTPGLKWIPGIPERFRGMSHAQIRSMLMAAPVSNNNRAAKVTYYGNAPDSFDWTQKRPECIVVRDQASCGSCWAFSAVGPLSDNRCFNGVDKKRIVYSEQYQVSCDKMNNGCNGGFLKQDMQFLVKHGVPTDKCVSYKSGKNGVTGKCPTTCDDGSVFTDFAKSASFEEVCNGEESIKNAVTKGSLQTAFTVYSDFMYYTSGIYHHTTGSVEGGHAVTIVGYGEEDGTKYWKVRNSWNETWGEDGYFRIIRGKNECGFENECYLITP